MKTKKSKKLNILEEMTKTTVFGLIMEYKHHIIKANLSLPVDENDEDRLRSCLYEIRNIFYGTKKNSKKQSKKNTLY